MGTHLIKIKFRNSHRNPMELINIKDKVNEILDLFISTLG
jgi:hypothetical protein